MRARCDRKNNLIVHSNWLTRRNSSVRFYSRTICILFQFNSFLYSNYDSIFFYYKFEYLKHVQWLDVTKKEYFFEEMNERKLEKILSYLDFVAIFSALAFQKLIKSLVLFTPDHFCFRYSPFKIERGHCERGLTLRREESRVTRRVLASSENTKQLLCPSV